MTKFLAALVAVALVGAGGYAYQQNWTSRSNRIQARIERLAEEGKISYDSLETSGFPFTHEILLTNPCLFYSLDGIGRLEGCLKGKAHLSANHSHFSVKTQGEFTLKNQNQILLQANGGLQQSYSCDQCLSPGLFNSTEILRRFSDVNYTAKDLTLLVPGNTPSQPQNVTLDGSMSYSRKQQGKDAQKFRITSNLHEKFNNLVIEGIDLGKEIGAQKDQLDFSLVIPSWDALQQMWNAASISNPERFPSFSLEGDYKSKNNLTERKGSLDMQLEREENSPVFKHFHLTFDAQSDLTNKEAAEKIPHLIDAIIQQALAEPGNGKPSIPKGLFKGFPLHLAMKVNLAVDWDSSDPAAPYSVILHPYSFLTDKGGLIVTLTTKPHEPTYATVELESFARVLNALVSRYNLIATAYPNVPSITPQQKERLFTVLQKYSDNPDSLEKNITFTITEPTKGQYRIGKHPLEAFTQEFSVIFQPPPY